MIPYVRDIEFHYGACVQVSPLIRRVVANNPGPFTFKGTGTYIVGKGEVAVIDPGPDLPDHLAAILAAVEGERVTAILVTHHHSDHSPLAGPLKAATGATIYGCAVTDHVEDEAGAPRMEAGHDLDFHPDVSLCGGGGVSGPGWTVEAIPTPGHTSNHICYALKEENCLFSGDHIMGWSTTVITPPDGDMTDYLESLETVKARGFTTLWPTHGPPILEVHRSLTPISPIARSGWIRSCWRCRTGQAASAIWFPSSMQTWTPACIRRRRGRCWPPSSTWNAAATSRPAARRGQTPSTGSPDARRPAKTPVLAGPGVMSLVGRPCGEPARSVDRPDRVEER